MNPPIHTVDAPKISTLHVVYLMRQKKPEMSSLAKKEKGSNLWM